MHARSALAALLALGLLTGAAAHQPGERLDRFTAEWGGAAFRILQPEHAGAKPLTLALGTVTRGEPRGSLRIYGRVRGAVTRLAAVGHDGLPQFFRLPHAPDGALQF